MAGTGNSGRQAKREAAISALLRMFSGWPRFIAMETIIPNLDLTPAWVSVHWNWWTTRTQVHSHCSEVSLWICGTHTFTCLSRTKSPTWERLSRNQGYKLNHSFKQLFTSLNSNYGHSTIFTNLVPYAGQLELNVFMANGLHICSLVKKRTTAWISFTNIHLFKKKG